MDDDLKQASLPKSTARLAWKAPMPRALDGATTEGGNNTAPAEILPNDSAPS